MVGAALEPLVEMLLFFRINTRPFVIDSHNN
jgi:hypothetical protein